MHNNIQCTFLYVRTKAQFQIPIVCMYLSADKTSKFYADDPMMMSCLDENERKNHFVRVKEVHEDSREKSAQGNFYGNLQNLGSDS